MPEIIETYYLQDLAQPVALFHGFDFGDRREDGTFGFAYNFIDYYFEEGPEEIMARAYVDEPGRVAVRTGVEFLDGDFGVRVLMFLALRYDRVFGADGREPLPEALMDGVGQRLRAHMAAFD